jgi:hypothetical protein
VSSAASELLLRIDVSHMKTDLMEQSRVVLIATAAASVLARPHSPVVMDVHAADQSVRASSSNWGCGK